MCVILLILKAIIILKLSQITMESLSKPPMDKKQIKQGLDDLAAKGEYKKRSEIL